MVRRGAAFGVDVLVNNAGGGYADDLLEISEEEWDARRRRQPQVARSCARRRVLPGMIERGAGVIVNITSVNGIGVLRQRAVQRREGRA